MNVFSFIAGADCAGISGRLAECLPTFRSMVNVQNYIDYPNDIEWDKETAIRLWTEADAVYSHHGFRSIRWAMRVLRLPEKPFLIHYHGASTFDPRERVRHTKELGKWKNARGVVSTLDLQLDTGLPWLPSPYSVDFLRSLRHQIDDDVIRIAHAPTNRALKSTAALVSAVTALRSDGANVELDVIENVTWKECLRRKAIADIYFDQVVLGYGCNALEAWGMGIPVIAGASDRILNHIHDTIGYLPFIQADESTIYEALSFLVSNPQTRMSAAAVGLRYVQEWHDYPRIRELWQTIWS